MSSRPHSRAAPLDPSTIKPSISTWHRTAPVGLRLAAALIIYMAALNLRVLALPAEDVRAYLTFYPAILAGFYLCGFWPGQVLTLCCALTGVMIFGSSPLSLLLSWGDVLSAATFLLSAQAIGLVIRQLQHVLQQSMAQAAELGQLKEHYAEVLDTQNQVICRYDLNRVVLYANEAYCRMVGRPRDEVIGQPWDNVVAPEDFEQVQRMLTSLSAESPQASGENRVITASGVRRWMEFTNRVIRTEAGLPVEFQSVGHDITEARELREELRQLSADLHAMLDNELVGIAKLRGRLIIWKNRGMERLFGYSHDELINQPTHMLYMDEATWCSAGIQITKAFEARQPVRSHLQMRRKDGSPIWIDASGEVVSADGQDSIWLLVDITEARQREQQIRQMALHDLLTGLPNRRLFEDRLQQALAASARTGAPFTVCFLDLDGFKQINDTKGHAAGDLLLQAVAQRLRSVIREYDTVARLGGDEFVLLLRPRDTGIDAQAIINRVIEAIEQPVIIGDDGETISVGASIGLAHYPIDGKTAAGLLHAADAAMYRTKDSRRLGQLHNSGFGAGI